MQARRIAGLRFDYFPSAGMGEKTASIKVWSNSESCFEMIMCSYLTSPVVDLDERFHHVDQNLS